jgi:hypothetical protein
MKNKNSISVLFMIFCIVITVFIASGSFCAPNDENSNDKKNFLGDSIKTNEIQDDGIYKAVIAFDPSDKQNISGYVHIPYIQGALYKRDVSESLKGLAYAMNQYTDIKALIDPGVNLDSPKLVKYPFLFMEMMDYTELTEYEKNNLRNYIEKGGFIVFSFTSDIKSLLGERLKLAPLPFGHPIYSCFYDIKHGQFKNLEKETFVDTLFISNEFSGIRMDGKLVGLGGIPSGLWSDTKINEHELKIGINILVYSLIRENSIARRSSENR